MQNWSMAATLTERAVLTPPELARRWHVSTEKILALIVRGELPGAFNAVLDIATARRPRWRIPLATVEQFEQRRAAVPKAPERGPTQAA